jgi:hypothetical protein
MWQELQKGIPDAYHYFAQQLGNGAIVKRLSSGRSFFDGRARGEGSKGYVGKRDAHNKGFGSGQRDYDEALESRPQMPGNRAIRELAAAFVFGDEVLSSVSLRDSSQVVLSTQC